MTLTLRDLERERDREGVEGPKEKKLGSTEKMGNPRVDSIASY